MVKISVIIILFVVTIVGLTIYLYYKHHTVGLVRFFFGIFDSLLNG